LIRSHTLKIRVPEQSTEAFLLEVPVIRQRLSDTLPAHGLHGNAIRQTVAFVRANSVEIETGSERCMRLRKHVDAVVSNDAARDSNSLYAQKRSFAAKEREELGKDLFRGDDGRPLGS
jgi:hypothetical protein